MKQRVLVGMFLTIVLLSLVACGASTGSSPATGVTPQPTAPPTQLTASPPASTVIPSPTATTESQPTPTQAPSANAQTVQVTLIEYQIIASQTTFTVNVPYHFTVTNKGQIVHQFMIMSVAGQGQPPLAALALVMPGQTKTLDVTFTQSAAPGQLEFACHLHGHYFAGMRLPIVVN